MGSVTSRRVLIVDDNVEMAENIAEILQIDGHVTDLASSAEEALPKALATRPDVLLTDFRLPGLNGADLVKRCRGSGTDVLAIVMSAYTDEATINAVRDAGAAFMPKPVDYRSLGRRLRDGHA